jgi:hypothetical protein
MKIKDADFDKIKVALMETLKAYNLHPFMGQGNRLAWQVFHKACSDGRLNCNELYRSYNDAHIETALKAIFK